MTDLVLVERPQERVAHVILNRPERRNALTGPLATMLADTITELNADDSLNVLVVRGAGGAFCSGLDLKEFGLDPQPDWVATFSDEWRRVHRALFDSTKIVVGALQRAAVNGGAALGLACDFLVAGDTSFLQVGEIQQGMPAPMNMAWLRLRYNEALSARVTLLGDRLTGPQLVDLGMAFRSVPDDHVLDAVDELVERLARHEPRGVLRIKSSLRRSGFDGTSEEWFARTLASDPFADVPMRPIAARET
ncbi:MAG: enoyl-CoA hydratase/isomerase family protein [Actinomycetia bacterium]|nr:enoyl-CoA hydratase/isomerase family protein [Actinomycetes bacterium]